MPGEILDRSSQRSISIFRASGIPTGHPNWRVLMSSPITFLSPEGNPLSQSRTGSFPESSRKNATGMGLRGITEVYLYWYVLQSAPAKNHSTWFHSPTFVSLFELPPCWQICQQTRPLSKMSTWRVYPNLTPHPIRLRSVQYGFHLRPIRHCQTNQQPFPHGVS